MFIYISDHSNYHNYLQKLKNSRIDITCDFFVENLKEFLAIFEFNNVKVVFDLKNYKSLLCIHDLLVNKREENDLTTTSKTKLHKVTYVIVYNEQNPDPNDYIVEPKDLFLDLVGLYKNNMCLHTSYPEPQDLKKQFVKIEENNNLNLVEFTTSDIESIYKNLRPTEVNLFLIFYNNQNIYFSKEKIFELLYRNTHKPVTNTISVYMCRLINYFHKTKLTRKVSIISTRRLGYKLNIE